MRKTLQNCLLCIALLVLMAGVAGGLTGIGYFIILRTDDPKIEDIFSVAVLKEAEANKTVPFLVVTVEEKCASCRSLVYQAERFSAEFKQLPVYVIDVVTSSEECQEMLQRVDRSAVTKDGVFVKSIKTSRMYLYSSGYYAELPLNTDLIRQRLCYVTGQWSAMEILAYGGAVFVVSLFLLILLLMNIKDDKKA